MHDRTGRNTRSGLLDRIVSPERIALLHGESRGDPNAFESSSRSGRRRGDPDRDAHVFPTKELRDEGGRGTKQSRRQQTLSNLAAYVTEIVRRELRTMAGKVFFQRVDVAGRVSSRPVLEDLMGHSG